MKVSPGATTLWIVVTNAAAFSPSSLETNTARTKWALFAEEDKAASEAAKATLSAGTVASKAAPFLAPVAALVAGRQALTKRDILREQEAITANDLNRIQQDLKNTDQTISASFGVAAVTSAIALTNLAGVQFNSPTSTTEGSSTGTPASSVLPDKSSRAARPSKTVDAAAPRTFVRKAPLALRTPAKTKPAPGEKDTGESSSYDGLLSKLNQAITQSTETPEGDTKASDVQASKPGSAQTDTPSFIDTVMQKVEEKKAEAQVEVKAPEVAVTKSETPQPPTENAKTEEPKVIAKIVEEPKADKQPDIPKLEAPKAEIPKGDAQKPVAEPPKLVVKPVETPKAEEKKTDTKAVASLSTNANSVIDSGASAVAVGAGVGVAALGIFAALVAAQDQDSRNASDKGGVQQQTPKSPAVAATMKEPVDQTKGKSVPLEQTKISAPEKLRSESRQVQMQMGPLVEKKKSTPKAVPSRPSMGALSYIDALSAKRTSPPTSDSKPVSQKPPTSTKKIASPGVSYLDSLASSAGDNSNNDAVEKEQTSTR